MSQIQKLLVKRVSGISKGIWGKTTRDGEYNQTVSNSMLIEIGGPNNTIEECKAHGGRPGGSERRVVLEGSEEGGRSEERRAG